MLQPPGMCKYEPSCIFCGEVGDVRLVHGKTVCVDCIAEMKKTRSAGTSRIIHFSSAKIADAISGSTAFFAPLITTSEMSD